MSGWTDRLPYAWDVVLGRPRALGRGATIARLVLIAVWPLAAMMAGEYAVAVVAPPVAEVLNSLGVGRYWAPGLRHPFRLLFSDAGFRDIVSLLLLVVTAMGLWEIVAYLSFLMAVPRGKRTLSLFACAWWRTCLWGLVVVPVGAIFLDWLEPKEAVKIILLVAALACAAVAPAAVAKWDLLRRRRLPRWRPVCPECGYSLRRLESGRCPECGTSLPTTSRVYRRWAIQRLNWDRRLRTSLVGAYIATAAKIMFCPCRAGRRMAIPDRLGRAVRWAAAHVVIVAMLGAWMGSSREFILYLCQSAVWSSPVSPQSGNAGPPPLGRVAMWVVESFGAWAVAIGALPALAIGLTVVFPPRHACARLGTIRWALYATWILLPVTVVWCGLNYASRAALRSDIFSSYPPPLLLAALYALWWGAGVVSNPYRRFGGWEGCLGYAVLYVAAWVGAARLLFDPSALECLL